MTRTEKVSSQSAIENIYSLDGQVLLLKSIPFGLQHVLAMFVANIAPIMIVAGIGTFVQFFNVWKLGARLAKGRLLGVQFETLFTDGLYFEISKM